ncbi:MAG TPA: hypothetical protein VKK31_22595 [Thermoanaerobaculia bacterium]|nr:hypothetical protein [Thermoanaerobaculia bacterium]
MTERERLRALVEDLPEDEVHEALRFVEHLRKEDPVLTALRNAQTDDEPVTQEDLMALEEAWEDVRQGRMVPHEEILRVGPRGVAYQP